MSAEPDVPVPMPSRYGSPYCPQCGYRCGCCCYCECQTPCPSPVDYDGDGDFFCECGPTRCHGGHEPWDCNDWGTRYSWAKNKSEELERSMNE